MPQSAWTDKRERQYDHIKDGLLVGYLSQDDAAAYRAGLLRLMQTSANGLVALHAVIVGGGPRRDGIGYLGVFLARR